MEKSNSFKRVLAGTLALLTVASSVPAEAGSVIGNFFSTALVANAENVAATTIAVTNVVVNGTSGTAKVTVNGTTTDANVEISTPVATVANVKQFKISNTDTTAVAAAGTYAVTVDGYTVIGTGTVADGALTVKVNEFIARPAYGTTKYEYDGSEKEIKFGKNMEDSDEGAMDSAEDTNTVEISYRTSASSEEYPVITNAELADSTLFEYKLDGNVKGSLSACKTSEVKRDNNGTATNHVVTLTGKAGGKYEGLVYDAKLDITPLDISSKVTVKENIEVNADYSYTTARIVYQENTPATGAVKDNGGDPYATTPNRAFLKEVSIDPDGDGDVGTKNLTELTDRALATGQDFTVTYEALEGALSNDANGVPTYAVNVGKYRATLNFTGNYSGKKTVIFRIVPKEVSLADLTTTGAVVTIDTDKTKVFNRLNERLVNATVTENDPYGLEFTTYKQNDDGTYPETATTDYKNVGTYKTVIKATGNYKNAYKEEGGKRTNEDVVAEVVWTVTKYNINGPKIVVEANAGVDKNTGKIVPQIVVQDKQEIVEANLAGIDLVQGTEYTVKYSNTPNGAYVDTVPEAKDLIEEGGKLYIYAKIEGIGNYEGIRKDGANNEYLKIEVQNADYDAASATLTAKTTEGYEKVRYQYGDVVDAKVTTAPAALSQDVKYYPVNLTDTGAADLTSTQVERILNLDYGSTQLKTKEELAARASDSEKKGYIAVVFVNRNAVDNTKYNPLFESKTAISKAFTVDKRTVSDSSNVEIEFRNPLVIYKGRALTPAEIKANIKTLKVDGVTIEPTSTDFEVLSTKTAAADINKDFTEVDDYSFKINFSDRAAIAGTDNYNAAFTGGAKFTGSYTTKIDTQKFSIVAAQLTAADFVTKASGATYKDIKAVYTKEGSEDWVVSASQDVTANIAENGDHAGYALAYYKIDQAPDEIKFDGKAKTVTVKARTDANGKLDTEDNVNRLYPAADYQVTGNVETAAGQYELTIKGVKNTKGSIVVKWQIDGNTFKDFTATADKTTFNYNGQGQAPTFTVTREANPAAGVTAATLTEGTDFVVEYYTNDALTAKLDTKPSGVGTYYAKIVGTGAYYGAVYKNGNDQEATQAPAKAFQFTIAPAADLDVVITAKEKADFSYNGKAIKDRVSELFTVTVEGKELETDEVDNIFHITKEDGTTDATNDKNAGKYKIAVTIYNDNYRPKTSAPLDFEITPKDITLSNIKADVKTAVYGAPVAQINDSITFDYDGVLEEDASKVSVEDFRGFVVVSNNYRSGSPAGEYTLTYNGSYVPDSADAKNYKAKSFKDTEKITIAKKDLADAKANVTLVIVPSKFTNGKPEKVAKGAEPKANQIVYNGEPYEVYIQDNDNGLMTMADLDFSGTPKAVHAGDYELTATASAKGNYKGSTTLELAWTNNECEIGYDVDVSVATKGVYKAGTTKYDDSDYYKGYTSTTAVYSLAEKDNVVSDTLSNSGVFGTEKDVMSGNAKYCVFTNVRFYTVNNDGSKTYLDEPVTLAQNESIDIGKKVKTGGTDKNPVYQVQKDSTVYNAAGIYSIYGEGKNYASEAAGDYTVYFYQLDDNGKPIEASKTTGYPTVAGSYRATVEFSDDFALVNKTAATEDPDYVPEKAKIGYVDFTVAAKEIKANIYDLNQLKDTADLTDGNANNDNKDTAFTRVYGDSIEPNFQVDIIQDVTDTDLVTAKFDVTKLRKYEYVAAGREARPDGAVRINGDWYKLTDTVYDGTAGYYDLEDAIITNNPDYKAAFKNVTNFLKDEKGRLVYEVERSSDYTIQFNQATNVFALKNGSATADFKVVDNNSGKTMVEGVDYTIKGTKTYTKTGTYTLFVEGIGNYKDTASADWKIVAANADTSVDAKLIDSNTVSFKDQVQFNFLAEINDTKYVDGAYVLFTYNHYGKTEQVKVPLSKQDMLGKYYRFRLPLTASEMAIDVKAELFLKNSAEAISTKTRSIKDYAETAIAKNMDGSEVLKAMLNYGGYTQIALKNNTTLLANASADIKEDVSSVVPKSKSTFVRPTPYEGTTTVGTVAGDIPQSVKIKFTPKVTYKGTTVMTKSMLYVRHYFTVDSSVTEDELNHIRVKSDWFNVVGLGNDVAITSLPKNSTGYYVDVPAEFAYNLDQNRGTVTVYGFPGTVTNAEAYAGDNGSTIAAGSKTYKVGYVKGNTDSGENYAVANAADSIYAIKVTNYNVIDYCEAIANNAKQTTAAKNMVKSLYKYYQAAEAYVAKRS